MKPDPLDAAVVNHRMDNHEVQQRSPRGKDGEDSPTDKHSPRNSDVIFESWDMVGIQLLVALNHSVKLLKLSLKVTQVVWKRAVALVDEYVSNH